MPKVVQKLSLISFTTAFIVSTMLLVPTARAQQDSNSSAVADDLERQLEQKIEADLAPQLEQKIRDDLARQLPQDIMRVLLQQNLLNHQIERGIDEYLKKQQQARALGIQKEQQLARENAKHVRPVTASRDHIYGNPSAPVSLIEYSDFECPFCKQFSSTPKEIVDAYGDKVNWVYRHFPLIMHNPGAEKEAEASECANELGGNEAFWKYANTIYARTQSNGKGFPLSQLVPLAKEIGLNKKRFQQCIESNKFASRVQEDIDEGSKIGVAATPTSILLDNEAGQVAVKSGALSPQAFKTDIDKMLEKETAAKNAVSR